MEKKKKKRRKWTGKVKEGILLLRVERRGMDWNSMEIKVLYI